MIVFVSEVFAVGKVWDVLTRNRVGCLSDVFCK